MLQTQHFRENVVFGKTRLFVFPDFFYLYHSSGSNRICIILDKMDISLLDRTQSGSSCSYKLSIIPPAPFLFAVLFLSIKLISYFSVKWIKNMQNLNFPNKKPSPQHECISQKKGDWIIWTCPHCEDYERKFNLKTGEMKANTKIYHPLHTGLHLPTGISPQIGDMMN